MLWTFLLLFFVEYLSVGVFFGGEKELEKSERELEKTRTHRAPRGARARARRARDMEKGKSMPDTKKAASVSRAMTRARDITSEPLM